MYFEIAENRNIVASQLVFCVLHHTVRNSDQFSRQS